MELVLPIIALVVAIAVNIYVQITMRRIKRILGDK